ncbi:MAG: TetR family transcriptional regulator [Nocardioides sp.]|nr:TetR family transcriptional regulator [Nocardioides sp.]
MTSERVEAPDEGAPRGRRLPPDERREQIVDCAARLFAERPYAQVSTTQIAREAGIARGLLNHYFGDKRALYLEVVRRAVLMTELERPLPELRGSLVDRVETAVAWFVASAEAQGPTYLTVTGTGMGDDPEVSEILAQADDLAARRMLEVLRLDADDVTSRAMVRAYGGFAKAAIRELVGGALTRPQATQVLVSGLLATIQSLPQDLPQDFPGTALAPVPERR